MTMGEPDFLTRKRGWSAWPKSLRVLLIACSVVAVLAFARWSRGDAAAPPVSAAVAAAPTERVTMKLSPEAAAKAEAAEVADAKPLARAADLLAAHEARPAAFDARLVRVYGLMAEGKGAQALEEARKLTEDVPNFALAHMVYADLLSAATLATPGFATYPPTLGEVSNERLDELTAEARARVTAAGSRPPPGTVPSQIVYLDPAVRHAIAVDVSKSRLYVFENTPAGPVLKRDYYASVGKLGISKQTEGDLRTPLGVYFITGSVSTARLADRYGAGALPLNYPNQIDQMRGRTGGGIWVHGVEASLYARAPLATDGCVALSNPDLRELSSTVNNQSTPVVIAESLQWLDPAGASQARADFMRTFEAWRQARQDNLPANRAKFYSQTVLTPAASAPPSPEALAQAERGAGGPVTVKNLSVLSWRDEDDMVVVTYSEQARRKLNVKRQYWMRQGNDWNIIFEGTVS